MKKLKIIGDNMNMKYCKVLIKTKSKFKKVVDICYDQGITWAGGDAKSFVPPSLMNKKPITLYIRESITYGIESDFPDDDGIQPYSYSEFIAKYRNDNFCIVTKTKEEFHEAQTILFENDYTWCSLSKDYLDDFSYSPTLLFIENKTFSFCDMDYYNKHKDNYIKYSLKEFKAKYKGDTMKHCKILIKTTSEFKKVVSICYDRGITWSIANRKFMPTLLKDGTPIILRIEGSISWGEKSEYAEDTPLTKCSYSEFIAKYDDDTMEKKFAVIIKTKDELYQAETILFEKDITWTFSKDEHKCGLPHKHTVLYIKDNRLTCGDESKHNVCEYHTYSFKEFMDEFAQSNSPTQYRFKTEAEFIEEYGTEFRDKINWNSNGVMDHLFGKELSDKENNKIQDIDQCRTDCDNWTIYKNMIIEIRAGTLPTEITMNFKTEKFKLSDSLFEVDKPNLKLDK